MASFEKKVSDKAAGAGGYKCPCCGPTPNQRDCFKRDVKRGKVKQFVHREIEDGVNEYY